MHYNCGGELFLEYKALIYKPFQDRPSVGSLLQLSFYRKQLRGLRKYVGRSDGKERFIFTAYYKYTARARVPESRSQYEAAVLCITY